jgi:alcohol dehydrogenase class IV
MAAESRADGFVYLSGRSKLATGSGVVQRTLAEELRALNVKRPLLVMGGRSAQGAAAAAVRQALAGAALPEFIGVPQHSSVATVDALAHLAREHDADGFVAVGGGSASDTAKGAAILLAEGGPLERHANVFMPPDRYDQKTLPHAKLPIVAVPTTLSAAEVTPGLGVRDAEGHKLLFWDVQLVPRLILLDPDACDDVPADVLLTTGMNALAHCVEGLYSRSRNPISEGLALQGLRLLDAALRAVADTARGDATPARAKARLDALVAAHVSGLVISNARVGIHHGVCHVLGALGGLPHGVANSVMLPHAIRYNRDVAAAPLQQAARALGCDRDDGESVARHVEQLQRAIGVPHRLRDTGLDRALLPAIARQAMGDRGLYFNPRRPESADEVLALLEAAW